MEEEDERLKDFALAVLDRARRVPIDSPYRFGRHKVFLSELGLTKHVTRLLWKAHQRGYLRLSRADLVPAMSQSIVRESEIHVGPEGRAVFHLVEVPATSRDKKKLYEVIWRYQGHRSSTQFGTREAADDFALSLRKRGVRNVSVVSR